MPTLVAFLVVVAGLHVAQGLIGAIRSRILIRIGLGLDEAMSGRIHDLVPRLPLKFGGKGDGGSEDIDQVQLGQLVALRFSAFNMRTTPEINGTVLRIGADTSTDHGPATAVIRCESR